MHLADRFLARFGGIPVEDLVAMKNHDRAMRALRPRTETPVDLDVCDGCDLIDGAA